MKAIRAVSIVISNVMLLGSCLPAELMPTPNCKSNFVTFKHAIDENNTHPLLKTNGVYISETGKSAFFLFKNGKIKSHRGGTESPPITQREDPRKIANDVQNEWAFNSGNFWGDYEIKKDSIYIQTFTFNNERSCKRYIYEMRGKIIDDSTIEINSATDTRAKDEYFRGAYRLKFYRTNLKPDSIKPWFNSRKWYQQGLHTTRR